MKIDLEGKTALVTGGTGELGRVMVQTLAECGANVIVHFLHNEAKAEQLVREIEQFGVRGNAVQADVTSAESVYQMARKVEREIGSPDIIVANAVVQIHPWQSVLDEDFEDYESQFKSCVMQSVYLAKAFIPFMIERGWGRYIAINTECAMEAAANSSAYVTGKRGLDGLVRTLAKEVGKHQVTVNQIAPGWTISDRYRAEPTNDEAYVATVPLNRRGTDQEIANVVAFMASDLSSYITGAYIPVCGGRIMPGI